MAVFTSFSQQALERYLVMFDLGEVSHVEPITAGIENSNYYIGFDGAAENSDADYVLTITEDLAFDEVPFFNDLLGLLSRSGLPVPEPQTTLDGMSGTIFCGKPTWLFNRLAGAHPEDIQPAHCEAIGSSLAQLHEAAKQARYSRANPYSASWARKTFEIYQASLSPEDRDNLLTCIDAYEVQEQNSQLPRGIIHGDLFRDNALFEGVDLTGIIDFYHACDDFFIQDIAITINDWCYPNGQLDQNLKNTLLTAYNDIRPLTAEENNLLPVFEQFAAMRFALTRLLSGKDGEPLKNPEEFLARLRLLA